MQTPSATLSAQIQANLNQFLNWSQATREQVYAMITASVEHYFASTPAAMAPTVAVGGGATIGGKKVGAVPDQWSRILNSKEYGVCAYPPFKAVYEEMKKTEPGLNYFTAISRIRTAYEKTPSWQEYLLWVRAKHPNPAAVAKDPSPRKTIGGVAQAVMTAPGVMQSAPCAAPTAGVAPAALPTAPVPVPQAVPANLPTAPVPVPQAVPSVPQIPTPSVPTVPPSVPTVPPSPTEAVVETTEAAEALPSGF